MRSTVSFFFKYIVLLCFSQYDRGEEADLYAKFKELLTQEEFLDLQEEYIKDEMRNLKRELIRAKEV